MELRGESFRITSRKGQVTRIHRKDTIIKAKTIENYLPKLSILGAINDLGDYDLEVESIHLEEDYLYTNIFNLMKEKLTSYKGGELLNNQGELKNITNWGQNKKSLFMKEAVAQTTSVTENLTADAKEDLYQIISFIERSNQNS